MHKTVRIQIGEAVYHVCRHCVCSNRPISAEDAKTLIAFAKQMGLV